MLVKKAKHRADKRTSFEKAQHRLLRVYNRPAYQHTVTALLVLVSCTYFHFPSPKKHFGFNGLRVIISFHIRLSILCWVLATMLARGFEQHTLNELIFDTWHHPSHCPHPKLNLANWGMLTDLLLWSELFALLPHDAICLVSRPKRGWLEQPAAILYWRVQFRF